MPATRFNLPSTGAAAVEPTPNASWNDTSIHAHLKCVTTKITSAMTTRSFSDADETNKNILFNQWVSDPIAAQTISAQTIKIQMRCSEVNAKNNLFLTWAVYVFNNAGDTLRGTVVPLQRDGTEVIASTDPATEAVNRGDSATSTQVISQDGDRIVVETGLGGDPALGGTHSGSIIIGDDSGTDLPENDTGTLPNNPWLQFTNEITFYTPPSGGQPTVKRFGGVPFMARNRGVW